MNAIAIGPLVFAPDRFAVILAIAAFLIASEVLARKIDRRFADWAWKSVLLFIAGARLGHVVRHADGFASEPLRALAFWQGGFRIEAGIVLALAYTAWRFRRHIRQVGWTLLPVACAAFVAVFVLELTAGAPKTPLPAGSFLTLNGEAMQPGALAGRPVVINLWATWCPPCRREMPMMAEIAANAEHATFVFVNQGEGREAIEAYLAAESIALDTVLLDALGQFGRTYAVPGLPATLFIGADGLLASVHMGEISREALISGIARLTPP